MQKLSAGILLYRRRNGMIEVSLFTPADHIGRRRTSARGRFPRENTMPGKTHSPQQKENFRKKPDSYRPLAS